MNTIKRIVRAILPKKQLLYLHELRFSKFNRLSTKEVFRRTYKENVWGGSNGEFNSGWGTTTLTAKRYIDEVASFIKGHQVSKILDIGCGDFRIMGQVLAQLDNQSVDYTGADIVDELIDHNNATHGNSHVRFICVDASEDSLPDADMVTIRQILQHLSNAQVASILKKLNKYKYVLITELLPSSPKAIPNLDKLAGPHDRTSFNSGVFIDLPPFNVKNVVVLLEYPFDETTMFRTSLITNVSV
jgi:SAM-dependent methyltransferase